MRVYISLRFCCDVSNQQVFPLVSQHLLVVNVMLHVAYFHSHEMACVGVETKVCISPNASLVN